jgi:hypothetical protein
MGNSVTDYTISVLRRALNEPFVRENTLSGSLGGVIVLATYK